MELLKIEIRNFRSIKSASIKFDTNCKVLVGKNEAGKSNVLKAIAAVFGQYNLTQKDKRKKIDNEKIVEHKILAIFKLTNEDKNSLARRLEKKFRNTNLIKSKSGKKLPEIIENVFYDFILDLPIEEGAEPKSSYWKAKETDDTILEPKLFLTSNTLGVEDVGTQAFNLINAILLELREIYLENPYKCHYWHYDENYLLPSRVNIHEFLRNVERYRGLENIFYLCGRNNIKKELEDAYKEDGDYSNLFEQVSKTTTSIFQKIWKDFKGTSIQLLPDGEDILIKVVNKAKYSFEDRSDGFKKFISILLLLSAQSRIKKIKERDIILIDEPDQSLYPTSARYLRDELIEISKESKVIYSTHSQYMIDASCIDRHLIVEKSDDVTTVNKVDPNSPYSEDELLRRAIGTSIFECITDKNIIFEGYLDKELFSKYCGFHKLQKDFEKYGSVYLKGISGVDLLVQILMLANKNFIIVSDADQTSNAKQGEFSKAYPQYKENWLSYSVLNSMIETMEDFLVPDYIKQQLINFGCNEFKYDESKPAMHNIDKGLAANKERKQEFKNLLVSKLKKEDVKEEYRQYVDVLKEKLDGLK